MSDPKLDIHLELDVDGESITGNARDPANGSARRFSGWLELMDTVQVLRREHEQNAASEATPAQPR